MEGMLRYGGGKGLDFNRQIRGAGGGRPGRSGRPEARGFENNSRNPSANRSVAAIKKWLFRDDTARPRVGGGAWRDCGGLPVGGGTSAAAAFSVARAA